MREREREGGGERERRYTEQVANVAYVSPTKSVLSCILDILRFAKVPPLLDILVFERRLVK